MTLQYFSEADASRAGAALGIVSEGNYDVREYYLHEIGHVVTLPSRSRTGGSLYRKHKARAHQDFIAEHLQDTRSTIRRRWTDRNELETLVVEYMMAKRLGLDGLKHLDSIEALLEFATDQGSFRLTRPFANRLTYGLAYAKTRKARRQCQEGLRIFFRGISLANTNKEPHNA